MSERKKLLLRLDPEVYDAVARWAADDLRSVNAQIEYALRRALRAAGRAARGPDAPEPEPSAEGPTPPAAVE